MVISFFVFIAAIQRLFDPPTVSTERLLVSTVCVQVECHCCIVLSFVGSSEYLNESDGKFHF